MIWNEIWIMVDDWKQMAHNTNHAEFSFFIKKMLRGKSEYYIDCKVEPIFISYCKQIVTFAVKDGVLPLLMIDVRSGCECIPKM